MLSDNKYDMTANKVTHANCELFLTLTRANAAVIKHGSCICSEIKQPMTLFLIWPEQKTQ